MVVFAYWHITLSRYADVSESIELLKYLQGGHSVERVSQIKSILSIIFHAIYRAVCIQLTYDLWWLWKYVYFVLLSSSNWKYDPFAII